MTKLSNIINRQRMFVGGELGNDTADLLEEQAREIESLKAQLAERKKDCHCTMGDLVAKRDMEIASLKAMCIEHRDGRLDLLEKLVVREKQLFTVQDAAINLTRQLAKLENDYHRLLDDLAFLAGMEPSHSMVRAANRLLNKARVVQKKKKERA